MIICLKVWLGSFAWMLVFQMSCCENTNIFCQRKALLWQKMFAWDSGRGRWVAEKICQIFLLRVEAADQGFHCRKLRFKGFLPFFQPEFHHRDAVLNTGDVLINWFLLRGKIAWAAAHSMFFLELGWRDIIVKAMNKGYVRKCLNGLILQQPDTLFLLSVWLLQTWIHRYIACRSLDPPEFTFL